jgi:L-lactate dehydrogenase complex protein LldF
VSGAIARFGERYRKALADRQLGKNLLIFQRSWNQARGVAFEHLAEKSALGVADPSFVGQRERLARAKDATIEHRWARLAQFKAAAEAAGATVYESTSAHDAVRYILELCRRRGARLVAKGKSMVSEEVFLNHALEADGLSAVETDLGEWIVQLAHETPSHMVMPAIHKSRQQIGGLLETEMRRPVSRENVGEMAAVARQELRRVFAEADIGVTGANALIAETGTVMLITNEGNGRLTSSLPPVHVVLAGWEKLVASLEDAAAQVRLLARSGTGQEITVYTTFITGPDRPDRELHIVIVDNGRSEMAADPAFASALRCIRCAACADVCPPYQVVGGHVFGHVYSGAIGLVNTAFHHGLEAAAGPQSLCVSCNACASVCPVQIPLPRQILEVRAMTTAGLGLPLPKRVALAIWSQPRLFAAVFEVAARLQKPFLRRTVAGDGAGLLRVPLPEAWRWRTPPAIASRPARAALLGKQFPPLQGGPLAQSGRRELTIAYFIQCLSDRFAPEQAIAAVKVLQACGARVVVPRGQHCCGLPAIDAGRPETARAMARHTIATLECVQADWIVTAAASCAIAVIHDYAHLFRAQPEWRARAGALAARTMDFVSFMDRVALAGGARGEKSEGKGGSPAVRPPPSAPVTYHSFCQSTNVLGIAEVAPRLLREVCGVEVRELPEGQVCCGFGGSTSLDHPRVAQQIVSRKLDNVAETGAAVLVTDNPGCLLHLRGAAHARGMPIRIAHVAEIMAQRLA